MMMRKLMFCTVALLVVQTAMAQNIQNNPGSNHGNKFEQLGTILPTPNEYRTASGAPGPKYWQQRCDYDITCSLDEKNLKLTGSEKVTYFNNSPDVLTYLWLQLDENQHSSVNNSGYQNSSSMQQNVSLTLLERMEENKTDNGYGDKIAKITDASGKSLKYTVNKTMMRVELPAPLKPGQQFIFNVDWSYNISDRFKYNGRGGYEFFPEDGNYLFTMTQWYPRLCVYSDFQGWQNHQFAGSGEFALTFGNFKVQMTVPADHMVGSTGECQNYAQVLSATQMSRWQKAQTAKEPLQIVTLDEAKAAESKKSTATKTWIFKADMVRDFAWTSSRKFLWDAMPAFVEGKKVMCMSFYGKEAYGLYSKYSTKMVAHTIKSYSKFTIPYPYPVAQSIEASNGMEYPMICFNYGRTEKDGTYSEATKNGMIGVIIHEVGHNFFPMIVNSDERQWTWMDEGLNTFCEYLTEELYDNKFPSRRGPAHTIVDYMKMPKDQLEPIMTNSENIIQFGPNAYSKPATGLNILRETIMGRELFDYAFKTYAQRWAFKHPTPADLFRTMEDASAEDLDWFWRGWFYSIDACDISIDSVKAFKADLNGQVKLRTPGEKPLDKPAVPVFDDISKVRNREDKAIHFLSDTDTTLRDFYWRYDRGMEPYDSTYKFQGKPVEIEEIDNATKQKYAGKYLYEVSFSNKGGLVMPIIVEWTFADGTKETERIAVQIWRKDENHVSKVFMKDKEVVSVQLDPMKETADINLTNNSWPKIETVNNFNLFKMKQAARGQSQGLNPMQKAAQK
ncbi:M1 family metallopeptidase [Panacibacter sp. DH6]|uniref:M1 family metallopeptidase n=1 Tax=Panacibacter microcysteis TaxID=2793269 RepID=A0A931E5T4_9BACT|nr:M1 family metallopeptidase [Panacibacter microcysteis]MBG9377583.1 M1 family metallopeptidase [Panacibacter microcysteis]